MRRLLHFALVLSMACGTGLLLESPARGQGCSPDPFPWPDGCSVPYTPEWVRRGLDRIFLGACIDHDLCYGACNGPNPPYLDDYWKAACDATLGLEMDAACRAESTQIVYPLDDLQDAESFLKVCRAVAGTFVAAIVVAGEGAFQCDQCNYGCNPNSCANRGLGLPALCGNGLCYINPPGGGIFGGNPGSDPGSDPVDDPTDPSGPPNICDEGNLVTVDECVDDCGGVVDEGNGLCVIGGDAAVAASVSSAARRTSHTPPFLLRIPVGSSRRPLARRHLHALRPAPAPAGRPR